MLSVITSTLLISLPRPGCGVRREDLYSELGCGRAKVLLVFLGQSQDDNPDDRRRRHNPYAGRARVWSHSEMADRRAYGFVQSGRGQHLDLSIDPRRRASMDRVES